MKTRISFVLATCAVALPAFATSGFTPSVGESGGSYHAMTSAKTRDQVLAELADWRRSPVAADGWRQIDGDIGWVFVGQRDNGKSRAQVSRELAEFRSNSVSADGWEFVGGELGWSYVGNARYPDPVTAKASRPTIR